MKILFISNFLPDTNYTRDLSTSLYRLLHADDTLYLCGRKNEPVTDGLLPPVDQIWEKGFLFFLPILRYVRQKSPDVIHIQHEFRNYGWLSSAIMFPWFVGILRLCGYQVVVTLHGIVSQKQLDKDFLEGFGITYSLINKYITALFLHYVYRAISLFASYSTVHTDTLKNILCSEYGFREKYLLVISHGVRVINTAQIVPKDLRIYKRFPTLEYKNVVLVFGYFSPRKGYEYIIDSFQKFKEADATRANWILVLAGDVLKEFRPYKHKIENLIKRKKLEESVLMTGFIDKRDIDELYRLAKIVIIPAVYSFNTSGALSIALAYQKPILVANVKPLADEITINKFGILYNTDGNESCFLQLGRLATDKKLYARLEASLRKSIKKRYWSTIAAQHYALYKKLI